jgi:fibronectin-binding autotransporter adhesin
VQDAAGNTGLKTTQSNNYAIDTRAPTTASVTMSRSALKTYPTALSPVDLSIWPVTFLGMRLPLTQR